MEVMGLDSSCVAEGACEVETARNLGVDYVISGSIVVLDSGTIVTLQLHEVRSGKLLASEQVLRADVVSLLQDLPVATQALLEP